MVKNILVVDDHTFGRRGVGRDPAAIDGVLGASESWRDGAGTAARAFDLLLLEPRASDPTAGQASRTGSPE